MANKDVRLRIKKQHIHINTLTFIHTPSYPARRTLHNEDGLTSQLQSPPCNHIYITEYQHKNIWETDVAIY